MGTHIMLSKIFTSKYYMVTTGGVGTGMTGLTQVVTHALSNWPHRRHVLPFATHSLPCRIILDPRWETNRFERNTQEKKLGSNIRTATCGKRERSQDMTGGQPPVYACV